MLRVHQTHSNDCFRASLASILEVPLAKVPDLYDAPNNLPDTYQKHVSRYQKWLYKKHRATILSVPLNGRWSNSPFYQAVPTTCIVVCDFPDLLDYDRRHCYIAKAHRRSLTPIFDPGRQLVGDFLYKPKEWTTIEPYDRPAPAEALFVIPLNPRKIAS